MGACFSCPLKRTRGGGLGGGGAERDLDFYGSPTGSDDESNQHAAATQRQQRLSTVGLDVCHLIEDTLNVIRRLVNNEQEPPASMLKLNMIAEKEQGWLLVVRSLIESVPLFNPLAPAVITLFLDESPLPTKETVAKLLLYLNLSNNELTDCQAPNWHRNTCIVLGCLAEKLAGSNSTFIFTKEVITYLIGNLTNNRAIPVVTLFSLIALEKFAQTSENRIVINDHLCKISPHPLMALETSCLNHVNYGRHRVGFCAQWALDNVFLVNNRPFSHENIDNTGLNAVLNQEDVSEYLKIGPTAIEARSDAASFESVRCTCQVSEGSWFYEVLILTPGVMQIGWATKKSKFLNHDGYGIGDDEFSVGYDGCRQLIWHNAATEKHEHPAWKTGDVLGCFLDIEKRFVQFFLNGIPLKKKHVKIFERVFESGDNGFFPGASFMSFQHCRFNFGHLPFQFPPSLPFQTPQNISKLNETQRTILPRKLKMERLRQQSSIREDSCKLCCEHPMSITLLPCDHSGICTTCADQLTSCPFCRSFITEKKVISTV